MKKDKGTDDKQQLYNGYARCYDRCNDCIHFKSYYFDEYDSDCWCEIFDDLKHGDCDKFEVD